MVGPRTTLGSIFDSVPPGIEIVANCLFQTVLLLLVPNFQMGTPLRVLALPSSAKGVPKALPFILQEHSDAEAPIPNYPSLHHASPQSRLSEGLTCHLSGELAADPASAHGRTLVPPRPPTLLRLDSRNSQPLQRKTGQALPGGSYEAAQDGEAKRQSGLASRNRRFVFFTSISSTPASCWVVLLTCVAQPFCCVREIPRI